MENFLYNSKGERCYPVRCEENRFSSLNFANKKAYVDPSDLSHSTKERLKMFRIDFDKLLDVYEINFDRRNPTVTLNISTVVENPCSPEGYSVIEEQFEVSISKVYFSAEDFPSELMKQSKYKLISKSSADLVVDQMNLLSSEDWKPHGGIFRKDNGDYCQVMKR